MKKRAGTEQRQGYVVEVEYASLWILLLVGGFYLGVCHGAQTIDRTSLLGLWVRVNHLLSTQIADPGYDIVVEYAKNVHVDPFFASV